ncbi:MAG: dienelactone hydrolase family protein [Candidatus Methylomirabilia bacterium]
MAVRNIKPTIPQRPAFGGSTYASGFRTTRPRPRRSRRPPGAFVLCGGSALLATYPDARHGFDIPDLPPEMRYCFGTLGYNAQAATEAWKEVVQFLHR